jgi:RNA polymerase sigma-70 factor (ECF subfamily)
MKTENQQKTDEEIARSVQKGNADLFAVLIGRYEPKLARYARKFMSGNEDIEDLLQEIFVKVYRNIQGFDTTRRFSPWIYRIAHNEFVNAIRKKGKDPLPFFDADTIFPHPVAKENPGTDSEKKELAVMLEKCLGQLNPKYREPLVLYYIQELSYQEISDIMEIPLTTVGVRIMRAKEMLKSICQNVNLNF